MKIETIERDAADAVVAEVTAPYAEIGEKMGEAMERVGQALSAAAAIPAGPAIAVYLNVDDETEWRVAVGFPVEQPVPQLPDFEELHLPGGASVVGVHEGPYDGLAATWKAVADYVSDGGLQAASPPWESFVASPPEVENPQEWVTEIIWPVQG